MAAMIVVRFAWIVAAGTVAVIKSNSGLRWTSVDGVGDLAVRIVRHARGEYFDRHSGSQHRLDALHFILVAVAPDAPGAIHTGG